MAGNTPTRLQPLINRTSTGFLAAVTNENYYKNLGETKLQFLNLENGKLVQPKPIWQPKVSESGREKKLAATDLKKGEHFQFLPLSENPSLSSDFRDALMRTKTDGCTVNPYSIAVQVLRVSSDILECSSMVKSSRSEYDGTWFVCVHVCVCVSVCLLQYFSS